MFLFTLLLHTAVGLQARIQLRSPQLIRVQGWGRELLRATARERVLFSEQEDGTEEGGELYYGDLVVYALEGKREEDGFDEALGGVLENGLVQPLCAWDRSSSEYLWDEELSPVDSSRIIRRIDMANVFMEQRKASRDVDPHGEHGEDAFIMKSPIEDSVHVSIRPERESNW